MSDIVAGPYASEAAHDLVDRWSTTRADTQAAHARGEGHKADAGKPDWSLLDLSIVQETVEVLTLGAQKYDRENWRKVPDARNRYFAALLRHLTAWQRGELADPETGKPHLAHASCCIHFLSGLDKGA